MLGTIHFLCDKKKEMVVDTAAGMYLPTDTQGHQEAAIDAMLLSIYHHFQAVFEMAIPPSQDVWFFSLLIT